MSGNTLAMNVEHTVCVTMDNKSIKVHSLLYSFFEHNLLCVVTPNGEFIEAEDIKLLAHKIKYKKHTK